MLFLCQLVFLSTISIRKERGLYQNKIKLSITFTQRLGYYAHNCKMVYRQTQQQYQSKGCQVQLGSTNYWMLDWLTWDFFVLFHLNIITNYYFIYKIKCIWTCSGECMINRRINSIWTEFYFTQLNLNHRVIMVRKYVTMQNWWLIIII